MIVDGNEPAKIGETQDRAALAEAVPDRIVQHLGDRHRALRRACRIARRCRGAAHYLRGQRVAAEHDPQPDDHRKRGAEQNEGSKQRAAVGLPPAICPHRQVGKVRDQRADDS